MPVETPGFISELNPSWPQDDDEVREGAAHTRVTKTTLQNQFPNLNAVVNSTPDEMNALEGATAASPLQAQIDALTDLINAFEAFEVGDISLSGRSSKSDDWLPCNGAAISRATYSALFAAIGTAFGAGNGSTTFNVPDLRGRTAIGSGTGSGLTARTLAQKVGAETHLLTANESGLRSHAHAITGGFATVTQNVDGASNPNARTGNGFTGNNSAANAIEAHNNMQPSLVVTYWIKAQ